MNAGLTGQAAPWTGWRAAMTAGTALQGGTFPTAGLTGLPHRDRLS